MKNKEFMLLSITDKEGKIKTQAICSTIAAANKFFNTKLPSKTIFNQFAQRRFVIESDPDQTYLMEIVPYLKREANEKR